MAIDPIYEKAKERAKVRSLDRPILTSIALDAFERGLAVGLGAYAVSDIKVCLPTVETTEGFSAVCGFLLALEAKKGKKYQGSWIKHGELGGAFPNVQRKIDRLEQCIAFETDADDIGGPEGRIETLADLVVYSVKWMTYLMERYPGEMQRFVERIRSL